MKTSKIVQLAVSILATSETAQANSVFAHVVVGVTCSYTQTQWESDMTLASEAGIDAFALNIAAPITDCTTAQVSYAFAAANALTSDFKLFFSFDYLGGGAPWSAGEIINVLNEYVGDTAHFRFGAEELPLVSTFEGTGNIDDWEDIRAQVGGIYFVPDWTSLGVSGFANHLDTVDGAFSWDMWPNGANDITSDEDKSWMDMVGSAKSFMMGVSPWFFTNLPGYHKAWVWRGDDMWHTRWQQVIDLQPPLVEIVTWNDYGESHYIGPIVDAGVPSGSDTNAHSYVDNMPHDHWLDSLPYYIAAYKGQTLVPTQDDVTMWYRLTPGAAGSNGGVTGNNCKSPINTYGYQECVDPNLVAQDKIFVNAIVASLPATIMVTIGQTTAVTSEATTVGINHLSVDFAGRTGRVVVSIVRNGETVVDAVGEAILSSPPSGVTNYNAWVGGSRTV